ncbi:tetraspanin-9 [Quercus suber]|uniref:Tetraspanin-9 n=1 Tax=Quercus suber TaxID=58331 RepID=A0AAW0K3A5_QUESU
MFRISNTVVVVLNCCTLVVGLRHLLLGVFPLSRNATDCQRFSRPLSDRRVFFFVVSILGIVGASCRINSVLYAYLFFVFLLIVGLIAFTVFALLVTNKGRVGEVQGVPRCRLLALAAAVREQRPELEKIKSCLAESGVCGSLGKGNKLMSVADFYKLNLSPIQSGCCKPPSYCEFTYKNATYWQVPKSGPAVPDSDCTTWSNKQDKLCYDCKSCKGGVLANIRKEWRRFAIINTFITIFIILVYCVGCCATKNNRPEFKYTRHSGSGYP